MNSTIDISTPKKNVLLNKTKVKTMKNILLALDTVGINSNAPIKEIGAVFFEPSTGEIGGTFHQVIDLNNSASLPHALCHFFYWALSTQTSYKYKPNTKNVKMWALCASFHNTVLRSAYEACNQQTPWDTYNDRDVRTMVDLGHFLRGIDPKKEPTLEGTPHTLLDNAKFQARYVSKVYMALAGCSSTCKVSAVSEGLTND